MVPIHNIRQSIIFAVVGNYRTLCRQSEFIALNIDNVHRAFQIRYLLLFFVSIFLGLFMRYVLHPSRVSVAFRHFYSFSLGLVFGLICFGPVYVEHVVELHHVHLVLQSDVVPVCSSRHVLHVFVHLITRSGANVSHPCVMLASVSASLVVWSIDTCGN